ncbi:phospholipase D family protein [Pseudomonas azerbaijanorientalis]|uniref:phospholipase D family protein n=1 Tax=Pseudomonas azerbaijanorientalis TaxID=2842350 RepID=UPI001C3DA441|nr:phospholipase D family protein [Pseudomonas azerbaijanorientalis]QXH59363.1 phospholipase D family protein [Pseudomonas azerbaijanorientalis]
MELILLPQNSGTTLRDIYKRALRKSVELYMVSAYLTHWDIEEELGDQCQSFMFIVGKDFGITRKSACEKVLKWIPRHRKAQFLAAELIDGFHPKALYWRELDGDCYALVGSSNLSKAAFSTNHEANGYSKISHEAFASAADWVLRLSKCCVTLDQNWLTLYREATQPKAPPRSNKRASKEQVLDLQLPSPSELPGLKKILRERREQMRQFQQTKIALESLFRTAAATPRWSAQRNEAFYDGLNALWSIGRGNRFQGSGWERRGKGSDFREFARSLIRVLDAENISRDEVVTREIDRLDVVGVSTRGALFSEMLCQFFPASYHLIDRPISDWLSETGVAPSGGTEGNRYLQSARLLRVALQSTEDYPAKNLAELDVIIWLDRNREH